MKNPSPSLRAEENSEFKIQNSKFFPAFILYPLSFILIFLLAGHSAQAATYNWSGATNGNMSGTPTNWGGTTPTVTDVASWNATSYTNAPTANAGMTIGELLFDSGNTGGVTFGAGANILTLNGISGIGIQLNNGTGAVNTGSAKFKIGAAQTWLNNSANSFTVNGTIDLNAFALTVNGTGASTLAGVISNGAVNKTGLGTLTLSATNTFAGGLSVKQGTVKLGAAAGAGAGTVTIGDTLTAGTLDLNGQTATIVGLATAGTASSQTITNSSGTAATLNYTGATTSTFGGVIQDGGNKTAVTLNNASATLTLSGTNTYTGNTTVTAGLLKVTGSTAAGSSVNVTGGYLGGNGTVGGNVTLSSTGGIEFRDGTVGTLTVGNLTVTGATGANNLFIELGNGTNTTDKIVVGGATSVTNNGAAVITLNQLGGLSGIAPTAGNYTLLQGGGTMAAASKFALATSKAFHQAYTLGVSGNNLDVAIAVGSAGDVVNSQYWKGSTAVWNTAQWYSDSGGTTTANTPGYNTNVVFAATSPSNLTNTLGADYEINSLTVNSGVAATSIGGTNMLTIDATGAGNNTVGNGITVSNAAGTTISSKIGLASSQTWTVNTGSNLTVSGAVTDFGSAYGLTKAGDGTLTLSANNTFTGGIQISSGTLTVNNSAMSALGSGTVLLGGSGSGNATLLWAISSGTPSNAINVVAGTGTRTLEMNQTGSVTFTGNISLNADLILDTFTGTTSNGLSLNGIITGSNKITIQNTAAGTAQTTIANNQNTFTGVLEVASGATLSAGNGFTTNGTVNVLNGGTFSFQQGATIAGLTGNSSGIASTGQNKTLTIAGNGTYNFSGAVQNGAGVSSLTINGAGNQTLSGTNTYNGSTTVTSGTLNVTGSIGSGATGTAITVNGGTLNEGATNAITGTTTSLTVSSGTANLSYANNFAGATSVTSTGTLALSHTNAIQNSALTLGGGTLKLLSDTNNDTFADASTTINGAATATINVDRLTSGSGNTIKLGAVGVSSATSATLTVTAGNSYGLGLGAVTQSPTTATTFTIANAAPLTMASFTTTSNATPKLAFTGAGNTTITGNINQSGTGILALDRSAAAGTLILQGTSNMTGSVTITAGSIQTAVATNAFGSTSGMSIGGSGLLALRGDSSATFGNGTAYPVALTSSGATINVDQVSGATAGTTLTLGTVSMPGGYTLNTTGANGVSLGLGAITGSTANNKVINNTIASPGGLTIASYKENDASTRTVTFQGTGNTTVTGTISQNGSNALSLTKSGAGTLTLSGNNTYTGTTTVTAGTLNLAGNLTGSNSTVNGATANFSQSSTGVIAGSGTTFTLTSGNATLSGTNTYTGATTLTAGTLSVGADANLGNGNALVFNGGTLQVTGNSLNSYASGSIGSHAVTLTANKTVGLDIASEATTFTVSTNMTQGTGGLTKSGAGTLVLSGNNTYTGTTTVSAGILSLGNAGGTIANTAPVTVSGGTLDVAQTDTVGAVTLSSGTISGFGTLTGTAYSITGNSLVSANLAGTGDLTKTVDGTTVILSGTNTYTGKTQVSAGNLAFGANQTVSADSQLYVSATGTSSTVATMDLAGFNTTTNKTIVIAGSGSATGGTNNLITGNGTLTFGSGGGVQLGNNPDTATIAGKLDLGAATRTFSIADSNYTTNELNITATISSTAGAYGITKTGNGTMTLSGANTYTGATTVAAGTLLVNGSTVAGSAFTVTGGSAAAAVLGGTGTINGPIGFTTASGGILAAGGSGAVGALITGAVSASLTSTIQMELSSASSYDILKAASVTATNFDLNVTNLGGMTFANGNSFKIFQTQAGGTLALTGTFGAVNLPPLSGGLSWDKDQLYTLGTLNVVPEPQTWALLAFSLTTVMVLRRRRRCS